MIRVFDKDPAGHFTICRPSETLGFLWALTSHFYLYPQRLGGAASQLATSWLKSLLTTGGCSADEVKDLDTHSYKVTALSWCAKAGISKEVRAILGYHSPKGSVMVYGRDNQAEHFDSWTVFSGKSPWKSSFRITLKPISGQE